MAVSRFQLTAVYEVVENGWIQATIAELPGVITTAPTREEATQLLHDALREYILTSSAREAGHKSGDAESGERDILEVAFSALVSDPWVG